MPKRTEAQNERRLFRENTAEKSEYRRTIIENNELNADLADLRKKYKLPAFKNQKEQRDWILLHFEIRNSLQAEIDFIIKKHDINDRMVRKLEEQFWAVPKIGETYPTGLPQDWPNMLTENLFDMNL